MRPGRGVSNVELGVEKGEGREGKEAGEGGDGSERG